MQSSVISKILPALTFNDFVNPSPRVVSNLRRPQFVYTHYVPIPPNCWSSLIFHLVLAYSLVTQP